MRLRATSCRRTFRSRIGGGVRCSLPLRNSRISVIPKDLAFIRNYISHICFDCVKQYYHCRVCWSVQYHVSSLRWTKMHAYSHQRHGLVMIHSRSTITTRQAIRSRLLFNPDRSIDLQHTVSTMWDPTHSATSLPTTVPIENQTLRNVTLSGRRKNERKGRSDTKQCALECGCSSV